MKKFIQGIVISTLAFMLILGIVEVGFRLLGFKTFKPITFQMRGTRMEPRPLFKPDSLTGLKLDTGKCRIYFETGVFWETTNNKEGYRITSTIRPNTVDSNINHIDILGCSFTYGTGLADTQTYPFLLQNVLPKIKVNNYAVPGQGMAANFVKLTRQLKVDSNGVVIYAYIRGHDFKTNNANRKLMYPSRNFMKGYYFLYLTDSLSVVKTLYDYSPAPLVNYSALANYLEDQYLAQLDNPKKKHETSKKAVLYMKEFCRQKGSEFVFTILTADEPCLDMLNFCKKNNIRCVDISVDVNNPQYNLMPNDDHPNSEANKLYSQKLYDYLSDNNLIYRK